MVYSKKRLEKVLCLDDFEQEARRYLPGSMFAYIAGATETNFTRDDNRAVFSELGFVTRALVDVSAVDTQAALWDDTYASPFGIAPMGLSAFSAYRGDLVQAQAAQAHNIPHIMSGSSLIRLEEVAKVGPNVWFQAYLPGKNDQIEALVARIAAAGFQKLVVTVDFPVAANRENNIRAGFSTPLRPSLKLFWDGVSHPRWTFGTFLRTLVKHGMPHFENNYATRGVPVLSRNVMRDFSDRSHLNWEHLALIRRLWKGKLVVKGILNTQDAVRAVEHGVDGIIVSNHGGRQLDYTVSPLRVLPHIVRACPQVPVMFDSGVRRGTDVLKALALGAKFVFVGRPMGFAAAVGGQAGVERAIDLLHAEVKRNCAMLGITRPGYVNPRYLRAFSRTSFFTDWVPSGD